MSRLESRSAPVIAVTGATGFVGQHLMPELGRRPFAVRALVRKPVPAQDRLTCVAGDLENDPALASLVTGATSVIHVAGLISAQDPKDFYRVNVEGTRALLMAAQEAGVARFIHVSSLAAREPGISDYARSKAEAEALVQAHSGAMACAILRPPALYGPGDQATLPLLKSLRRPFALIPGTLESRISLLLGADFARMLADAVLDNWTGLRSVSDGRKGGYAWADLTRAIGHVEGRKIRAIFLPRVVASLVARSGLESGLAPAKVRELYHPDWAVEGDVDPGFVCTQFEEGYRLARDWYRANGMLS